MLTANPGKEQQSHASLNMNSKADSAFEDLCSSQTPCSSPNLGPQFGFIPYRRTLPGNSILPDPLSSQPSCSLSTHPSHALPTHHSTNYPYSPAARSQHHKSSPGQILPEGPGEIEADRLKDGGKYGFQSFSDSGPPAEVTIKLTELSVVQENLLLRMESGRRPIQRTKSRARRSESMRRQGSLSKHPSFYAPSQMAPESRVDILPLEGALNQQQEQLVSCQADSGPEAQAAGSHSRSTLSEIERAIALTEECIAQLLQTHVSSTVFLQRVRPSFCDLLFWFLNGLHGIQWCCAYTLKALHLHFIILRHIPKDTSFCSAIQASLKRLPFHSFLCRRSQNRL